MPPERVRFEVGLAFTAAQGERMRLGHIPQDMADKWFVFFEEGWLYFHRSWTGLCIYAVRLEETSDGVRLTEGWVNRRPDERQEDAAAYDRQSVADLVESRLLGDSWKQSSDDETPD